MSVFVSQLVEEVIKILYARGVSERERELIEEATSCALATRYVSSYDFNLHEIIERVTVDRVDNLSEEEFDVLTGSVGEHVESRIEDLVREEVDDVLRRMRDNPNA